MVGSRYSRGYSFTSYQANNPSKPLPGPMLDVELNNIQVALDSLETPPAAWAPPEPWAPQTAYTADVPTSLVVYDGETWYCLVSHTSDAFFDATKWLKLVDKAANTSIVATSFALPGAPYVRTVLERAADGLLSIDNWLPSPIRSDIKNQLHTGDVRAYIQSALQSGEHIALTKGKFPISDWVFPARQGQRLVGAGIFDSWFSIDNTGPAAFNMSAPGVIKLFHYCEATDFRVVFRQPSSGTGPGGSVVHADLIQYPWAFDITQSQHARLGKVGWDRAWNGINAKGELSYASANNPSGSYIYQVLDGAFNTGIDVDGVYDFMNIDSVHSWEYGYVATTVNQVPPGSGLSDIPFTNPGYALKIGHCESLNVGHMQLWMRKVLINNDGPFKNTIGSIKFDGWASRLEHLQGRTQIGRLDMLCNADSTFAHSLVRHEGGTMQVANPFIHQYNEHTTPVVEVTGGRLVMGEGTIEASRANGDGLTNQIATHVSGGVLELHGVSTPFGSNMTRTAPFHKQSGSGILRLRDCAPAAKGAGSGNFVELGADLPHGITDNDFAGWGFAHNGITLGNYENNENVGSSLT